MNTKKDINTIDIQEIMPVLFVGHGNPMNAIEENEFSREWRAVGKKIPKPAAILCISAHWETGGTLVTGLEMPPTIHDFGGFPRELFEVTYPARGSKWLTEEIISLVTKTKVVQDTQWGLDHGCWSVLKQMFPNADIPVVQLSLDRSKSAQYHFELAKQLAPLREKGVLILGSGNLVHNLSLIKMTNNNFNTPFGFDWAIEANQLFKELISKEKYTDLINYQSLGKPVQLAAPTPEHYLPFLYVIALKQKQDTITYFNDAAVGGSLTMTSLIVAR